MTQTQTDNTSQNAHFIKVFDKDIANKLSEMSGIPFMKERMNGKDVYVFDNTDKMQEITKEFNKQFLNKPVFAYNNHLNF